MEIINKEHKYIKGRPRNWLRAFIKFESESTIYFSAAGAHLFGFKSGVKVNFVNDGDLWWLYIDNSKDGFEMVEKFLGRGNVASVLVHNANLVKYFIHVSKCSLPCKFPLSPSKAKINGNKLIKIEINKPLE